MTETPATLIKLYRANDFKDFNLKPIYGGRRLIVSEDTRERLALLLTPLFNQHMYEDEFWPFTDYKEHLVQQAPLEEVGLCLHWLNFAQLVPSSQVIYKCPDLVQTMRCEQKNYMRDLIRLMSADIGQLIQVNELSMIMAVLVMGHTIVWPDPHDYDDGFAIQADVSQRKTFEERGLTPEVFAQIPLDIDQVIWQASINKAIWKVDEEECYS